MMEKRRKQPAVADILPSLVRDNGWEVQLDLHSVFDSWDKIVDSETARHCRPLKIRRGVLWLEADNSSWLQQLRYQKNHLLDSINASLERSRLDDIKYVLPAGKDIHKKPDDRPVSYVSPPPEEVAAFRNQISFISDHECRDALFRFWYLARACKRV